MLLLDLASAVPLGFALSDERYGLSFFSTGIHIKTHTDERDLLSAPLRWVLKCHEIHNQVSERLVDAFRS
jgi:hypothetical protein